MPFPIKLRSGLGLGLANGGASMGPAAGRSNDYWVSTSISYAKGPRITELTTDYIDTNGVVIEGLWQVSGDGTLISQNESATSGNREFQIYQSSSGLQLVLGGSATVMSAAQSDANPFVYRIELNPDKSFSVYKDGNLLNSGTYSVGAAREPNATMTLAAREPVVGFPYAGIYADLRIYDTGGTTKHYWLIDQKGDTIQNDKVGGADLTLFNVDQDNDWMRKYDRYFTKFNGVDIYGQMDAPVVLDGDFEINVSVALSALGNLLVNSSTNSNRVVLRESEVWLVFGGDFNVSSYTDASWVDDGNVHVISVRRETGATSLLVDGAPVTDAVEITNTFTFNRVAGSVPASGVPSVTGNVYDIAVKSNGALAHLWGLGGDGSESIEADSAGSNNITMFNRATSDTTQYLPAGPA